VVVGLAGTVLLVTAPSAATSRGAWQDPSPHVVKSVTVDTGVQLEVLDWGGSGPGLVLLAGGGATAHQYDDLAPALAARHRVIGVTRRGHRGSSAPPAGYGFPRRAEDVVRVMEAVGVTDPVIVGSSIAGEEMHVLGARHPSKIRGLVYVDAAFDRGDDQDEEAFAAATKGLPGSPGPEAADLATFTAFRAFLEKHERAVWPEGYLRTRYRTNPDGSVGRMWAPDRPVFQEMTRELRAAYDPYKPERIHVPALAIYAAPASADDLMRRGSSDRGPFPESVIARVATDPALRERVGTLFQVTRARVRTHQQWFAAFASRGRVVDLPGSHDLIVSNPRGVLEQIERFVASLPKHP
jgi:pimeloyl-ACP methyl ester carboxylesterase